MDIIWRDRTSTSLMTYEQVIKDVATVAKKEGVEEGISEGVSLVKKETVARMIKNGSFSDDTICEIVGVSSEELDQIKLNL